MARQAASAESEATAPAFPSATPSAVATPPGRPGLGAELDVVSVDRATTEKIDVFASTGNAIVFSAGLLPDAEPGTAPDLWRITPGVDPEPKLVWRNPARDHALTSITGDLDTVAFVDLPVDGTRAWNLYVVPRNGEAVLLDAHPGDLDVPSLVPSVAVYEPSIVWTSYDRGPNGAVSQLLTASAPDWEPRVLEERLAAEAELWLPSLYGDRLVYTEVVYPPDGAGDERRVYLASVGGDEPPLRLDTSGRATMPVNAGDEILWKEAERGMNMFNWGTMFRYDLATGEVRTLPTDPQDFVNYPSAGYRFVAWWGATSSVLGVYDLVDEEPRTIERYDPRGNEHVLRPHVSGDLIAWIYAVEDVVGGPSFAELRYAWLPPERELQR